ncbi:hypothetical protein KLP40_14110 [Hymenobacter sp. NST-14]|uniref:reprolysin-like metallopeptidase n=1 Tax=Hymenobacter piscis TaxID=2839984 RepID=UPI001C01D504|nr:zinc-dependent metalloprotease family protein [Hymenobacter piscis]MBT9394302.1 hypothetical protein [Hymenobacter piscis]
MQPKPWLLALLSGACSLLLPLVPARAQPTPALWQPAPAPAQRGPAAGPPARWFRLDTVQLAARLARVPAQSPPAAVPVLELPHPDGTLHRYALTPVSVMAPALAARYPRIHTFAGRALDDPAATVRLEWTPTGLHAQLLTAAGAVINIDRAETAATETLYRVSPEATAPFDCQALLPPGTAPERPAGGTPPFPPAPYGSQLRTLRVAIATTGEYTQQLGGGTVAGTMDKLNSLVNSLNGVYEREFALRLQLVGNNDKLIFLDAATDPYNNASPSALLDANAAVLNNAIGLANYDLGHVLGRSGGGYSGVAYVGVVCSASTQKWGKGGGASTASSDGLMNTVVRHEIGHQLGSGHTFNGDQGNCSGGNRSDLLAYEPGAGNTVMSYDQRCAPDNVGDGIIFFHAGSLSAIMPKLTCGTLTSTGNQPPTLSVPPRTYTIPLGTPFSLSGSGSDPNGDALTYSWEQLDLGNPSGLAGAATDPTGPPLFRSFAPVASASRTFPQLSAILSNTSSLGEMLPLVPRALNFRLTARDNRGGVAGANVALTVANAGPFRVTAPATAATVRPGSLYNVTWDVLGTDQAPVSCANVQILFSSDGGQTFPTTLLASTPNDGAAEIRLPATTTTQGRLKVQAVDNVFFAISPAALTLSGQPLPVTLVSFRAEVRGTSARLNWRTATELRNAGFVVEVSTDGAAFRQLAWVPGQGQAATYEFTDSRLLTHGGPLAYYRLRQRDDDGTESFSQVQTVAVPAPRTEFQLWPNPTHAQVMVAGLPAGHLVQLLDLTGRVLLTATMPPAGPLSLALPAGLGPGVYLVRGGARTLRLVVE